MNQLSHYLGTLRQLTLWQELEVAVILLAAFLLLRLAQRAIFWSKGIESLPQRLLILRVVSVVRLAIAIATIAAIVPILFEPSFDDIVALVAGVAILLAFTLKDYFTCLVAGIFTVVENTYQLGDWIELEGAYGEVRAIGLRAVHIVTVTDNEVIIPHSRMLTEKVTNASGGRHSLLVVVDFFLDPDHDGAVARKALADIGRASKYRLADSGVRVAVTEVPWGTHYKLMVTAEDSRQQFAMRSDLTVEGKACLRAMGVKFARTSLAEGKGASSQ